MKRWLVIAAAAIITVPIAAASMKEFPKQALADPPLPSPVPFSEIFTRQQIGRALAPPTPQAGRAVADPSASPADDGQWTMPEKNYAATRYSALSEINPANVRNLREVFSFSLETNQGP